MTTENALAGGQDPSAQSTDASQTAANSEPAQEARETDQAQEPAPTEATNSGEPSAAKDDGKSASKDAKKPVADQERNFSRMRDKLRNKEAENAALLKEVERLRRPLPVKQDATDDERAALNSRQSVRDEMREQAEERAEQAAKEAHVTRREIFEAKVSAVQDRSPEALAKFYAVPCSPGMADYLAESDKAGEIAIHLGSNPHEARRISELSGTRAAIELAKLEGRLQAPAEVRRVSQAPAPAQTRLAGGASPPAVQADKASVGDLQAMLKKAGVLN